MNIVLMGCEMIIGKVSFSRDRKLQMSDGILDAMGYPERISLERYEGSVSGIRLVPGDVGLKISLKQRRPRVSVHEQLAAELGMVAGQRYAVHVFANGFVVLVVEA